MIMTVELMQIIRIRPLEDLHQLLSKTLERLVFFLNRPR
jgi:hypothetical protein